MAIDGCDNGPMSKSVHSPPRSRVVAVLLGGSPVCPEGRTAPRP